MHSRCSLLIFFCLLFNWTSKEFSIKLRLWFWFLFDFSMLSILSFRTCICLVISFKCEKSHTLWLSGGGMKKENRCQLLCCFKRRSENHNMNSWKKIPTKRKRGKSYVRINKSLHDRCESLWIFYWSVFTIRLAPISFDFFLSLPFFCLFVECFSGHVCIHLA